MKIAMITPGYLPVPAVNGGAVEILIQRLIEGNEKGEENTIDVYSNDNIALDNYSYKNTNIIKVKISRYTQVINGITNKLYQITKRKKWRTSYGREVIKRLRNKEYDFVVVHNNLMAYRDIYELTENKENLVYVLHNDINVNDENHVIIAKLIGRTAKKILAVSNFSKNEFVKLTGNGNIDVLYNCVKLEEYRDICDDQYICRMKEEYGIADSDFVFMFSGRIDIYKGVLELIKAFKRLKYENVKLLVVGKSWFDEGEGNDSYSLEVEEQSREIKDRIVFTGFVKPEKMPFYYKMADCLVVPSIWEEPFGVVALEGMAAGLALIVTDSGGLTEVIDDTCAFVVEKENDLIQNLYQAMEKIYLEPIIVEKMKRNAISRVNSISEFDSKNYYKYFCEKLEIHQ